MKVPTGRCLQLIILCDWEPYVYDSDISPITELASCGSTFTSNSFFLAIFQKVNEDWNDLDWQPHAEPKEGTSLTAV